jgi:hypothetical protein
MVPLVPLVPLVFLVPLDAGREMELVPAPLATALGPQGQSLRDGPCHMPRDSTVQLPQDITFSSAKSGPTEGDFTQFYIFMVNTQNFVRNSSA